MTDDEIKALPRQPLAARYGQSFVVLTPERFLVQRNVVAMHLADVLAGAGDEGLIVHKETYVDCADCRDQRRSIGEGWSDEGQIALKRAYEESRYWCNGCQGMGWRIEPWEACVERLRIVTWEARAEALSGPDLTAALRVRPNLSMWPDGVLAKEAARRLEAA